MNPLVLSAQSGATVHVGPSVVLYILPAIIAAELAWYGWHRRQVSSAALFSLLMGAIVFWSACHALSAASTALSSTLFWAQVQYGGIVLVGPLWLLFTMSYSRCGVHLTPARWVALLLPALLSYIAVLSNNWHHWWWSQVALDFSRPFGSLALTRGWLFWLHLCYSYACVLLGLIYVLRALVAAPLLQRRKARLVACSALVPLVGNGMYLLGFQATAVDDPTPLLFCVSGLLIYYAALRYHFLDPSPITTHELIASLPDGVAVLDTDGSVALMNASATRRLALSSNGTGVCTVSELIAGSPFKQALADVLSPAGTWTRTATAISADGTQAVEFHLRPLYTEWTQVGSLLVVHDRTECMQLELSLAQLQDSLIGKSTWFATISHELRAPLTSIIGYTDLLGRGSFGTLPSEAHEALSRMRQSSLLLLRVINDVLDFAKMEAGHFEIELAPVDLKMVIHVVGDALQPQIHDRGLAFKIDIGPDLPLVYADYARLEQVLMNLIVNAIKFTDKGSVTVRAWRDGERVRFSVTDTGIGISPDQLQELFQPFHQLTSELSQRMRGTGLGLVTSQRLVQLMGGTLRVESELGCGSTFIADIASVPEPLQERAHGIHSSI